ncbi:universal stress protein [Promineifilum sp.]|uniref:universal stress protein n=1 Tax=Promineifilum sp. TaxID=2664178 RepID=UPI0035AF0E42
MLNRILVPLDKSALAEGVLPHALAISRAFDATVTFVHVIDQGGPTGEAKVDPLNWHMLKAEAQSYLQGISSQWPATDHLAEAALLEGAAAERILAYAGEQDCDLIILSSHGRSGLSEWNISTVVQKIIMRAFRSVMIVRAAAAPPPTWKGEEAIFTPLARGIAPPADSILPAHYERILVPLDGSRRAESVLPIIQKLIEANGLEVILAHIVYSPVLFRHPPTPEDTALVEEFVQRNLREATDYLDQICERLGPCVKRHIEVSESPADTLINLTRDTRADLVLLSAHGRTAAHHYPYGNLVTGLINYSNAPLLIYQDLPRDPSYLLPGDTAPGGDSYLPPGRGPGRLATDD